jgi:1-phosphofructokinase
MITTFTLNPCIDRMLYIEDFHENQVNRVGTVKTYAGGKGINVSRVLKILGSDTLISSHRLSRNVDLLSVK